jgi:nicotinamide riboside kinase
MNAKKYFELYISTDTLSLNEWHKFYQSLLIHLGILGKFEIIFRCTDNVIRLFISCNKDLSVLSNGIDNILLRPVNKSELELPRKYTQKHFVRFVTGGNLLALKEKLAIKRNLNLQYTSFNIIAINSKTTVTTCSLYFLDGDNNWLKATNMSTNFPSNLLAINFANNTRYFKKSVPKYLNIEKTLHMMVRESRDALFKIDPFPYLSHNYYLNLAMYDFDRHSFIIGASGSGKSKLISLFIDRLSRTTLNINYRIVVIDPHASLADDLVHIPHQKVITFGENDSTDLFPDANVDLASATELTTMLFKSILNDQFNPRLDKLLRFSLFTLMTAQIMSLANLKRFLTDTEYRTQVVEHVAKYIPQNIVRFWGTDFNELRTKNYSETILPIISMIDEMQLQPSLVGGGGQSLSHTIGENFLTVFSLNKISMGEKTTKTIAGLLIQQIFLLAQSRTFGQKIILIIDEVSVIQNPALTQILAEARKFNLTVILAQQYFGQIAGSLRQAIFANVVNYYVFKVSEEDARALEGNLNISLPKELIKSGQARGLKESDVKVKIMTELHSRECLVRVMSNGQIAPCIKARTTNAPEVIAHKNTMGQKSHQLLPKKFIEKKSSRSIDSPVISADKITSFHEISDPPAKHRHSSIYKLITMSSSSTIITSRKKGSK